MKRHPNCAIAVTAMLLPMPLVCLLQTESDPIIESKAAGVRWNEAYRDGAQSGGTSGAAAPTVVHPGQDIQAAVDAHPPGTAFLLKPGLYRIQAISPKNNNTFTGEGAVLSGARQLANFAREGPHWVAAVEATAAPHGECEPAYPRCRFPEQLFIDEQLLRHVASRSEVRAGAWFLDYDASRIYLADDPANRRVEMSVTPTAFAPTGDGVTVKSLVVEKYANPAQQGAINAAGRVGWSIVDNEVRWNHGLGIGVGSGARVVGNRVHHNGQLGIGGGWGSGLDILVEGNEIAYNNTAHFNADWEAGGAKFAGTTRLIVRKNYVHDNGGPGLWTDTDNVNTLYEQNTSDDNARMGIFHEISYAAMIRSNTVRRNGFGFQEWIWGAGILVSSSPDVEISNNTVEDNAGGIGAVQQKRGIGAHGSYQLRNLYVHDNQISMSHGLTGLVQDVGDTTYFTSRNNRFERNRYHLGPKRRYFAWMNQERSESEWRNYQLDVNGTFVR
jgi:hypothetical protein